MKIEIGRLEDFQTQAQSFGLHSTTLLLPQRALWFTFFNLGSIFLLCANSSLRFSRVNCPTNH
jgi:hypothetical protein